MASRKFSAGTRNVRWYHRHRVRLIDALGGRCVACGATGDLDIDHPNGRDYKLEELGSAQRIRVYKREAASGLVRLLCAACNRSEGAARRGAMKGGVSTSGK